MWWSIRHSNLLLGLQDTPPYGDYSIRTTLTKQGGYKLHKKIIHNMIVNTVPTPKP